MTIDAFVMQPHYLAHIAPVWHALPVGRRGVVHVGPNINEFADLGRQHNLPLARGRPPHSSDPLIMAGGADLWAWEGRPVVLIEHGAGQTYSGQDIATYSGGIGRDAVVLFLCPNETVAARNRNRYPAARAVAVGAPTVPARRPPPPPGREPVVAVSWHWDCEIVPEARTSWPYWADAALDLAHAHHVLGHAHPRIAYKIIPWWERNGVRATNNWDAVLHEADVFVADNSSTLYEFAATGRPVVVLDAPWYRRDVEHGLRFWSHADVGARISRPEDLIEAVDLAFADPAEIAATREAIVADVFVATGTAAAAHAAREIMALV